MKQHLVVHDIQTFFRVVIEFQSNGYDEFLIKLQYILPPVQQSQALQDHRQTNQKLFKHDQNCPIIKNRVKILIYMDEFACGEDR